MKSQKPDPGRALDRFFDQISKPSPEQLEKSRRNIFKHLSAGALPTMESVAMPRIGNRRSLFRLAAAAVAAAVVIAGATLVLRRHQGSTMATASDGTRYRASEPIRAQGIDGFLVRLEDGSRVEMREDAELSLESASDGVRIRLKTGEVIVNAAKQRRGHLYVQTKDMVVSVVGTVFLVDAGDQGSRVAVIQGEVRVRQDGMEKRLHPGDQVASNPDMNFMPMPEEMYWSRDAESHMALLAQSVAPAQAPAASQPVAPSAATFKWEAVAIRPCEEGSVAGPPGGRGGAGLRPSPGRITFECMTVEQMISLAYERYGRPLLNASGGLASGAGKLRGGPPWVRRDKYRIEAKAVGTPGTKVMEGPMLRAILEDRFQLKIKRETEEAPMYALVVAKGGLKIQPVGPDDCRKRTPDDNFTYEQILAAIRRGEKPYCGMNGGSEGPNIIMDFGGSTLSSFAGFLSGSMDRHVLDKTGIDGRFNIHFEYLRDENTSAHFSDPVNRPDVPPAPSIFSAVEDLGLKLEPTKGPREYLVIEGIERPDAN